MVEDWTSLRYLSETTDNYNRMQRALVGMRQLLTNEGLDKGDITVWLTVDNKKVQVKVSLIEADTVFVKNLLKDLRIIVRHRAERARDELVNKLKEGNLDGDSG